MEVPGMILYIVPDTAVTTVLGVRHIWRLVRIMRHSW